jgi:hypothetical protein
MEGMTVHKALTGFFWLLLIAYLAALALFLIGTFGMFGQEADPLSGIFLIPLGFPWFLIGEYFTDAVRPWIAALAPIVNLAIVKWGIGRTRVAA